MLQVTEHLQQEKTRERTQYLWKLVAKGVSPTRAVEALSEKDGLAESTCWKIWRLARDQWKEERPIERSIAVSIVWHQAQDHLLRLLQKIQQYPDDTKWYQLVGTQLSTLANLARDCGPEVLEVNLNHNVTQIQSFEVNLRVERILGSLPEHEQRIAARILAKVSGFSGEDKDSGGNSSGNQIPAQEVSERVDSVATPGDSTNRIAETTSSDPG